MCRDSLDSRKLEGKPGRAQAWNYPCLKACDRSGREGSNPSPGARFFIKYYSHIDYRSNLVSIQIRTKPRIPTSPKSFDKLKRELLFNPELV